MFAPTRRSGNRYPVVLCVLLSLAVTVIPPDESPFSHAGFRHASISTPFVQHWLLKPL
jgi:hypothetical protein